MVWSERRETKMEITPRPVEKVLKELGGKIGELKEMIGVAKVCEILGFKIDWGGRCISDFRRSGFLAPTVYQEGRQGIKIRYFYSREAVLILGGAATFWPEGESLENIPRELREELPEDLKKYLLLPDSPKKWLRSEQQKLLKEHRRSALLPKGERVFLGLRGRSPLSLEGSKEESNRRQWP